MENREVDKYGRLLQSIRLAITLKPNKIQDLKRKIPKIAKELGVYAYPRAEGYALMHDESVGALGLPHLRIAFVENRSIVWVRDPYNFKVNFLRLAGYSIERYYNEILRIAKKLEEVFRSFQKDAEELSISLPE